MSNPEIVLSKKVSPDFSVKLPDPGPRLKEPVVALSADEEATRLVNLYTRMGMMPPKKRDDNLQAVKEGVEALISSHSLPGIRIIPFIPINLTESFGIDDLLGTFKIFRGGAGNHIKTHVDDLYKRFKLRELNRRRTDGLAEPDTSQVRAYVIYNEVNSKGKTIVEDGLILAEGNLERQKANLQGKVLLNLTDCVMLAARSIAYGQRFVDQKEKTIIGENRLFPRSTNFPQLDQVRYSDSKYSLRTTVDSLGRFYPTYTSNSKSLTEGSRVSIGATD